MIKIEPGDPDHPQVAALLTQSHELMEALFPSEDNHYLSLSGLKAPNIHLFTARLGDTLVGTGALANMGDYGEVKSMFVAEEARGQGVAYALLRQIEDQARALDLPWLRLETGNGLNAALDLYAGFGFDACGPFGDYTENATSLFMEKRLN